MGKIKFMITNLKAWWMAKTPVEKVKSVTHGIVILGGAVASNEVSDRLGAGHNIVERACLWTLCCGAGIAVEDVAMKQLDGAIDEINESIQWHKAQKEANGNA